MTEPRSHQPRDRSTAPRCAGAFTIIEGLVSMVIISVIVVASLGIIGSSARERQRVADTRRADELATMLLNEISALPLKDIVGTAGFGKERGESASPREFDDIDDYNGFVQSPPKYGTGNAIPGFTGWTWQSTITRVRVNGGGISSSATDTGCVRIQTEAISPRGVTVVKQALRTRWAGVDTYANRTTSDVPRVHFRAAPVTGGQSAVASVELLNLPFAP